MSGFLINSYSLGVPFSPTDISGLALWLDASDTSTITEVGGSVSQWDDKSGNGYDVTQASGAVQPSTGLVTVNGRNVLSFVLGDFLSNASGVITGSTNRTIFGVVNDPPATPTGSNDVVFGLGVNSNGQAFYGTTEVAIRVWGGNTIYDSGVPSSGPSIIAWGLNGTTVSDLFARANGVALGVTSVSFPTRVINTQAPTNIGQGPTASQNYEGDIAEILMYDSALSGTDIDKVEQYLANKWGVTL